MQLFFKYFENTDPYAKLIFLPHEIVLNQLREQNVRIPGLTDVEKQYEEVSESGNAPLMGHDGITTVRKGNTATTTQSTAGTATSTQKRGALQLPPPETTKSPLGKMVNRIKNLKFPSSSNDDYAFDLMDGPPGKNGDSPDSNASTSPLQGFHNVLKRRKYRKPEQISITLTGGQIRSLIAKDDPHLQMYNPIQGLLHYGHGVFQKVTDEEEFSFPLQPLTQQQQQQQTGVSGKLAMPIVLQPVELLTFHVQRDIPVDQLHFQSTLLFSSVEGAIQWLKQAKTKISQNFQIRMFHPRYLGFFRVYDAHGELMRIDPNVLKMGTLKLMLEKVVSEEERKNVLSAWKGMKSTQDMVQVGLDEEEEELSDQDMKDELDFEIVNWEDYKADLLAEKGFSEYAKYELTYKNTYHSTQQYKMKEVRRAKAWKNSLIPPSPKYVTKRIKVLIRQGISEAKRREVWMGLTGGKELLRQDPQQYERVFKKLFSNYTIEGKDNLRFSDVQPRLYPEFGGKLELSADNGCYLNDDGKSAAKRVLCILAEMHKDVDCCPTLPDAVHALLIVMNEHDACSCVSAMLGLSKQTQWYFRTSRMQHALFVESFSNLIRTILPEVGNHFDMVKYDIAKLADQWFTRLFFSFLPLHIVLRALDGFMHEGSKILYRAGFAVLKLLSTQILQCKSASYMTLLICEKMKKIHEDELFKALYNLGLTRKHMMNMDKKTRESISEYKITGRVAAYVKPKIKCTSQIIQGQPQWDLLFSWVPYRQRLRELHKLYSTEEQGYSMQNLVKKCKDSGAIVLLMLVAPIPDVDTHATRANKELEEDENMDGMDIVELIKRKRKEGTSLRKLIKENEEKKRKEDIAGADSGKKEKVPASLVKAATPDHCILGVYCGESLEITHRYAGTTDTFVFSLYPVEAAHKWTRKNDFFVLGRNDSLSFGGAGEGPALRVDDTLNEGVTYRSETFDNDPLCPTERFKILKAEAFWFR
uniref:Rab-GAP TBC domain-containing protein n=1 Tax=Percolomonas cosmopolitus TaxID=63605 RepID=A0A7S1PIT7_9EUKA|mmetsp:Transcript_4930/g.18559  ORF Transcript_4930/g.18559 Transcript_4930/m.18559 type:complete len:981 (+) Transcript_4930:221-3163(+)